MDFVDMLYYGVHRATFKSYKILIVDECQDLNPLLWKVIRKLNEKAEYLILAGDDDQAIYKFNAGDVIWNTNKSVLQVYTGSKWQDISTRTEVGLQATGSAGTLTVGTNGATSINLT